MFVLYDSRVAVAREILTILTTLGRVVNCTFKVFIRLTTPKVNLG